MNTSKPTGLIGFDPSFVNCGVAFWQPSDKKLDPRTFNLDDAVNWAVNYHGPFIAVVENPDLDSNTFNAWASFSSTLWSWKVGTASIEDVRSAFAISNDYAQKVGKNKAAAQEIIRRLKAFDIPVLEVAPSKRDRAFRDIRNPKTGSVKRQRLDPRQLKTPTKTTQKQFEQLTGFDGSTSEHARDAATLVWNRSIAWAEGQVLLQQHAKKIDQRKPQRKTRKTRKK